MNPVGTVERKGRGLAGWRNGKWEDRVGVGEQTSDRMWYNNSFWFFF